MTKTSRRSALLGMLEIAVGVLCILLPALLPMVWLLMFGILAILPIAALLYICLKMLIEGIGNLMRSWKCSGFQ